MKIVQKSFIMYLLALFVFVGTAAAQEATDSNVFHADLQSRRIAAGTIINLRFLEPINSITGTAGSSFNACLEDDIRLNKKVVLPAGTLMRGTINNVKRSKLCRIPAAVYLDFDHLVTPDGRQIDVAMRLTDISLTKDSLGISGGGSYKTSVHDNFDDSVDLVHDSVDWGNDVGDKFLNGYPKLIITPLSATGGFMASTAMFAGRSVFDVFRKGNDVLITQDQVLKGCLTEPIDIPIN